MLFAPVDELTEDIARKAIGAAIEVHKQLGPGFLERIYEEALCFELTDRGIPFESQQSIAVRYKTISIPGQRVDLVVGGRVILELKAVTRFERGCQKFCVWGIA